ncbi:MAG: ferrous iron transport protein B [Methanobacteriota archaeon]|nr:MAG: ferrous iron transport protein B [Euryarchaeota archaeon]
MKKSITIALAGNANVGKSVLFNGLTGLTQIIGNWPGKTVEKAEGTVNFGEYTIQVVDLPGIYSLSTYTIEEVISREFIALEKPDVVVNVIDATALERNLFFTVQLLELDRPMVIALNQMDLVKKKGIDIDVEKLEEMLGVPVVPTVATRGSGFHELLQAVVEVVEGKVSANGMVPEYGPQLESRIKKLIPLVEKAEREYPSRWVSMKLLEGDENIKKRVGQKDEGVVRASNILQGEIEDLFHESSSEVIASDRYRVVGRVVDGCQELIGDAKLGWGERLDDVTTHKVWGYLILAGIVISIFTVIFLVGDFLSVTIGNAFEGLRPIVLDGLGGGPIADFVWSGLLQGLIAGVTIALPFLIPFFIFLAIMEATGYLARIAFLMDGAMHRMGLHGKAFIPLLLGYGCNVPACMGCRVMETHRERLIAVFVVTLVPCAAVTVVVLGVVGTYVGIGYAFLLYFFNLLVIFALGRIAFKAHPGEPVGLKMEMPPYRIPSAKVVLRQTWVRLKDFIMVAFPFIIIGSLILEGLRIGGLLGPIGDALSPITVGWLGLPVMAGVVLLFGFLRKELTLIMFATLIAPLALDSAMSPVQMVVFTLVVMFFVPCVATLAVLIREIGWKRTGAIVLTELLLTLLIGGVAFRVLSLAFPSG